MFTLGDFKNYGQQFAILGRSSIVAKFLYQVQLQVVGKRPYWWNVDTTTLTTVDGTVNYALSGRIDGRRVSKMNNETSDSHINLVSLSRHLFSDATPTEEGTCYDYSFIGQKSVQSIAAAAATLSVVSSAAGDTTQEVIVRGLVSGVEQPAESISLNGTTPVASANTYDDTQYLLIQKSATTTGNITITSGTTTIAVLGPNELKLEVPWVRFRSVPSAAYTMRYWFYKKPQLLSNDYEIPDLPAIAHAYILLPGLLEFLHLSGKDYTQASYYKDMKAEGIRELNIWSDSQPGKIDIKEFVKKKRSRGRYPETMTTAYGMA